MSFNNFVDSEAAINAVKEINPEEEAGVAIIKHTNPCGFATSTLSLADAFERAWDGDPVSAFGSVIACNKEVDLETAEKTNERFIEIIIAPSFSREALEYFSKKKNLRLIKLPNFSTACQTDWELKFVTGGVLSQSKDNRLALTDDFNEVFKPGFEVEGKKVGLMTKTKPSLSEKLYEFAWKACKHVKSNAIILARTHENGCMVLGMGAGQPNRLDAVRKLAVTKAKENIELIGGRLEDCVLASDAFFPFRDSIDVVAETGVKNVIQPGGSIRDDEVIKACDEKGISMVFTGVRHFKH
jgi:phosphoribosylaminoimidazolecarboxamide formyltransferase/IMP cyclohydrolase